MGVGDEVVIPSGILHEIDNRHYGNESLIKVVYEPALKNQETVFQRLSQLSFTDALDENGFPSFSFFGLFRVPNIFIIAELFVNCPGFYKAWFLPDLVQDFVFHTFYHLGKLFNCVNCEPLSKGDRRYHDHLPKYE